MRMHHAPVPASLPRYAYLASKNAKRAEQLQWVTQWMAFVVGMWAIQGLDGISVDFTALWGLTGWFCGLQLPETVHDLWSGPPILEHKPRRLQFVTSRSL
jgi:hypothetical protein